MSVLSDPRLRPFLLGALASGAVFIVVLAAYRAGLFEAVDHIAAAWLRDMDNALLDALAAVDDALFRPTATFAAALLLTVLLARFGPPWSWCAPPFITVSALAEVILKVGVSQVFHLRALVDGVLVVFGGHFHAPASFPSGHVTRAMFLAVVLLAFAPRKVSIPLLLLALTAPVARMYTEAHRLSDVVGGTALGTCIGAIAVCVALLAPSLARGGRRRLTVARPR